MLGMSLVGLILLGNRGATLNDIDRELWTPSFSFLPPSSPLDLIPPFLTSSESYESIDPCSRWNDPANQPSRNSFVPSLGRRPVRLLFLVVRGPFQRVRYPRMTILEEERWE